MDETRSGMSVDWSSIRLKVEANKLYLVKAIAVASSLISFVNSQGDSFYGEECVIKKEMLEKLEQSKRDLSVSLHRLNSFTSKCCEKSEISDEWIEKRDDLAEGFASATKFFAQVTQSVLSSLGNLKDFDSGTLGESD